MATKNITIMSKKDIAKELKRHENFLRTDAGSLTPRRSADFTNENLCDEDFSGTNLSYARFCGATLRNINFSGANLTGAYFDRATLDRVNFSDANLIDAHFTNAQFLLVDLSNADMQGAKMALVDFDRVTVNKDTNLFIPLRCPSSGSFIGWKKAYASLNDMAPYKTCIVKLWVPEDARRSSSFGEKCRCNKAIILGAYDYDTGLYLEDGMTIRSIHSLNFTYHIGDTIIIPDFDDNRWEECSSGFHFFIDEESARRYWS